MSKRQNSGHFVKWAQVLPRLIRGPNRSSPRKSVRQIVRLRRAKHTDLDVLVYHRRRMWEDMGEKNEAELEEHDRVYRRWARSRLKTGVLAGWVAETRREGVVASGTVWLRPAVPRPRFLREIQAFLLSMYTEPKWRNRGLASRILDKAIKWARRKGFSEVLLHASSLGKHLYIQRGFRETSEMRLELA